MATSPKPASTRAANKSASETTDQQDQTAGTRQGNPEATHSLADDLKQQHRQVETLLTSSDAEADLPKVLEQIADAWIPHTAVEEEVILPAIGEGKNAGDLAESAVRRDLVKILLQDLLRAPNDKSARGKFSVLSAELQSLIEAEEDSNTGMFSLAADAAVDLDSLRPQAERLIEEIHSNAKGQNLKILEPTVLRSLGSVRQEYSNMPYDSNTRDRDSQGRFRSDDDDGRRHRGNHRDRDENGRFTSDDDRGYRSRSSRDYDDDYRRSGSNGGGPGRDEDGRFTSGGGRYEEDDRRGSGHGGWYGDSRGRSEASQRGWENREGAGYPSRRDYDDDRGGSYSRSRDDDGRYSRSRDDDRGGEGRGWYGDSRGHSEAAREGWEHRQGGGSSYRSSRYDNDDEDRSRRGSHGGWFGDSRGHSEASRRGWDDRR